MRSDVHAGVVVVTAQPHKCFCVDLNVVCLLGSAVLLDWSWRHVCRI